MSEHQSFPGEALNAVGLNRQAVFDVASLPEPIRSTLGTTSGQLILIGHAGKQLWQAVQAAGIAGSDPIDDFTIATLQHWFADFLPGHSYQILYPGEHPVGLQALGKLAGWHQPSPFMLGIDSEWGTWYAYRAAILADSNFLPSTPVDRNNPCASCQDKPCITHCPAGALDGEQFSLNKCISYRRQADSPCQFTCLARISCPVGLEHRYDEAQLRHTYAISLQAIRQYG
jgi:epoxyqueuosine reductase